MKVDILSVLSQIGGNFHGFDGLEHRYFKGKQVRTRNRGF